MIEIAPTTAISSVSLTGLPARELGHDALDGRGLEHACLADALRRSSSST